MISTTNLKLDDSSAGDINQHFKDALSEAFQFFNEQLFNGEQPDTVMNVAHLNLRQRADQQIAGVFAPRTTELNHNSIELDFSYVCECLDTDNLRSLMATLVHEMVHQWNYINHPEEHRKNGHSKTWRARMAELGLAPRKVGLRWTTAGVTQDILEHGIFARVYEVFPEALAAKFLMYPKQKRPIQKKKVIQQRWFIYNCPTCATKQKRIGKDGYATCSGNIDVGFHEPIHFLQNGDRIYISGEESGEIPQYTKPEEPKTERLDSETIDGVSFPQVNIKGVSKKHLRSHESFITAVDFLQMEALSGKPRRRDIRHKLRKNIDYHEPDDNSYCGFIDLNGFPPDEEFTGYDEGEEDTITISTLIQAGKVVLFHKVALSPSQKQKTEAYMEEKAVSYKTAFRNLWNIIVD